jgi:hypothetical protein
VKYTQTQNRAAIFFLLLLGLLIMSGCGGGGGNNASGTGAASLSITWPTRSRLIPAASNSIRIIFTQNGTILANQLVPRPATGGTSSITVNNLKVGALIMAATAYPNADGTGVAQATGTSTINIADNQTTSVTLTMNSTIDHLEVTPSPLNVVAGSNVQVVATAKDASGAVVLTTPGKFTFNSATTSAATIDTNGLLHGVSQGSSQITVVETESSKQIAVTANVAPIPGPVAIYVADQYGRLIRMNDMNGANWKEYNASNSSGFILDPEGICVDSANRIYAVQNNTVFRMDDMNGTGLTTFTHAGLNEVHRITLDSLGRIYMLTSTIVARMDDMQGNGYVTWAGPPNEHDRNWDPVGIAVDSQNRIYTTDIGTQFTPSRLIRVDDMTGANMVILDGSAGTGHTFGPLDVAVDGANRIYIADINGKIDRVDDMAGTNFVSYGTKGSGTGQFNFPFSISVDGAGRLYIADPNNHRIVRMDDMNGSNWMSYGSTGTGVGQFGQPVTVYVR